MRSAFDKLISWTGLLLAAVLIVAGGLLTWASTFIGDQVHDQLTMQQITMPEGEALASLPKADADALQEYAGSPLDTGPEAKAFLTYGDTADRSDPLYTEAAEAFSQKAWRDVPFTEDDVAAAAESEVRVQG